MDKAGIQQLVEQLELAMRRIPAPEAGTRFASMKGKLSAPVKAAIHARFGTDSNGVSRQGLTFEANSGESVLAVHTGRVVFADRLRQATLWLTRGEAPAKTLDCISKFAKAGLRSIPKLG